LVGQQLSYIHTLIIHSFTNKNINKAAKYTLNIIEL